jgi:uncharacterized protein YndB with AHSA1/START domain
MATAKNKNALTITRIFDAPRELVWRAWTEPEYFKRWWGPKSYTMLVCKIDLRVGGKYLTCMRSPEGLTYWSTGAYREILKPERIVCTDSFSDEKGNVVPASHYGASAVYPLEMLITVIFEECEGKTKQILKHEGIPSGKERDDTQTGLNESLDKLSDLMKKIKGQP